MTKTDYDTATELQKELKQLRQARQYFEADLGDKKQRDIEDSETDYLAFIQQTESTIAGIDKKIAECETAFANL